MNKKFKQRLLLIIITIILSIINILLTINYSNAETSININEYIEFTINFDKPIITSDFSISYDKINIYRLINRKSKNKLPSRKFKLEQKEIKLMMIQHI